MSLESILKSNSGRKVAKRKGVGSGSGLGKTCGRGQKGQGARSGGKNRPTLYEGGQFKFWQRLPKRGFSNFRHTTRYQVLPLERVLARVEGEVIDGEALAKAGLAGADERVKIVSPCEVSRKVTVKVAKVSGSVAKAIEAAGGSVESLDA